MNNINFIKNIFKEYGIYNKDFFKYIFLKTSIVNFNFNNSFYNVLFIEDDNVIKDIKVIVPSIDTLENKLINIHEFIHALYLYYNLNEKIDINESFEEKTAIFFEYIYLGFQMVPTKDIDDRIEYFRKRSK